MVSRRQFLLTCPAAVAVLGSLGTVVARADNRQPIHRHTGSATHGYGKLLKDPDGLLDLPARFHYRVLSREDDPMDAQAPVPAGHDGMGTFALPEGNTALVCNHENSLRDTRKGLTPVKHLHPHIVYDPEAIAGGTSTLLVGPDRKLIRQYVSLAGTLNNCAGGVTPWQTWLTCEEDTRTAGKPHGYVFEVDPRQGGNPQPITAMGRFKHEAVSFDRRGTAYLTEDSKNPFGCLYRFIPARALQGRGSLHAGGRLQALSVQGLDTDLSVVQNTGTVLKARWIDVPDVNPGEHDTPVREQVIDLGATPIQKAEGSWPGNDGSIWFVSSWGDGPDINSNSAAAHDGQIWRYDPYTEQLELVVLFPRGTPYNRPDNISSGPHGFAIACTDSDSDQWLLGITEDGRIFPFGFNALNQREFAGATFSPDGQTLFVNMQGPPGMSFAIWGPWQQNRDS